MGCTIGKVGLLLPFDFRDDFERDDGPLGNGWINGGIYPIGSVTLDPTRYLEIDSGQVVLGTFGAGYAWRTVPRFTRVELGFEFGTGSTGNAGVGVIISDRQATEAEGPSNVALNSIHTVVSPSGRQVGYYQGAISPAVDTDTFTLAEGTDYVYVIDRTDDDTIHITDPDTGEEDLSSPLIDRLWGDTLLIEVFQPEATVGTDDLARINYVWVQGQGGVELLSPNSIRRDGNTLRIGGEFAVSDTEGRILAAQLLGYGPHNTDEPVVRFTYDADQVNRDLDGFYAVAGTEIDYAKLAAGLFSWNAELIAVPNYQAPRFESIVRGRLRTNSHSIAAGDTIPWHSPGADPTSYEGLSTAGDHPVGNAGTLLVMTEGTTPIDTTATWTADLDSYEAGGCRLGVTYDDGITWHAVTGRQIINKPSGWRLSNSAIRVEATPGGETAFDMSVLTPDGPSLVRTFRLTSGSFTPSIRLAAHLSVLDNRNEQVKIRVRYVASPPDSPADDPGLTLDILLRRGARYAEFVLSSTLSSTWGVIRETTEAATSLTGGIRSTVGLGVSYYVLSTPRTLVEDLTNGGIRLDSADTVFPFCVGLAEGPGDELHQTQGLIYGYHAAVYERQQVIDI